MAEAVAQSSMITLKEQQRQLRDGKILGFECGKCRHRTIIPVTRCIKCASDAIRVVEFATTGKVVTYTIQSVASEQFLNEVPFAWVVVELEGGPRVSGWIPFISKPNDLLMGQKVKFTPSYKPGMMFEKA